MGMGRDDRHRSAIFGIAMSAWISADKQNLKRGFDVVLAH